TARAYTSRPIESPRIKTHHPFFTRTQRTSMNRSSRAAASIALTASIALVGCAPSAAPAGDSEPTPAAVEVDEGLLTVDITIARSLLDSAGTMTDEQIVAAAAKNGILARVDG